LLPHGASSRRVAGKMPAYPACAYSWLIGGAAFLPHNSERKTFGKFEILVFDSTY